MNYTEFRKRVQNYPFFTSQDIVRLGKDEQVIRNQLHRWQAKGLIIQLKRGVYLLNENDRKASFNPAFLANQLYAPSYISLEYALNFYGLIPEKVVDITSVTTKKTIRFDNQVATFIYQHIKPQAFRGFKVIKDASGLTFFIAEPEKAIIDFFYLNLDRFVTDEKEVFVHSYRFQNLENLSLRRIAQLATFFDNRRLKMVVKNFCGFVKEEVAK